MMPIVHWVGQSETINIEGMTVIGILFSALNCVCFFTLFSHLRNYPLRVGPLQRKIPLLETMKLLLSNKRVAALTLASTLTAGGELLFYSFSPYFFIYVLNRSDYIGTFNWASKVFAYLGTLLSIPYMKMFAKKRSYLLAYCIQAVMFLAAYHTTDYPPLALLAICCGLMGQSIANCMVVPMYSDISDHMQNRGKNVTGAVMGVHSLVYKLAGFVGAAGTFLLVRAGFHEGTEPNESVIQAIKSIAVYVPFLLIVAGIIIMFIGYHEKEKPIYTSMSSKNDDRAVSSFGR